MKSIALSVFALFATQAIHVEPGHYDRMLRRWGGYIPQCDEQCADAGGEICGTTFQVCCQPGQCVTRYNRFELCG